MKEYNKEILKDAANRLLFDMTDEQYDTLLNEFDIITKQMEIIGKDSLIDDLEPMVFPFECFTSYLREDVPTTPVDPSIELKNVPSRLGNQVKLPKVVK